MRTTLLFISLSFLSLSSVAQTGAENTVPVFFEKAYLHTDRDVYGQGENIWFKAYVVNAQDNTPINYSHNLYVELIGPGAKLIRRETIRLEGGLGNGDFKLSDAISPGHYRIRAYTNWMRNFGDNFVFEKYITILQTSDISASATRNNKSVVNKNKASATVAAPISNLPVVRFYPEGGSLVAGIRCTIGVKAEDANGKGIAAEGNVQNNAGQNIAAFNCDNLGFGSFTLQPQAGQHYQSIVMLNGKKQSFILPEVQAKGFGLQVSTEADTVKVTVSASPAQPGSHIYLVARHGGKSYVRQALLLTNESSSVMVTLPKNKLPEGIAAITLYDEQNQPQCERLVYVHHADQVKLNISTERTTYAPKGEVTVRLKLNSKEKASLSMAAVTMDIPVPTENILSYLNLQSEIRGTIEEPNRYFDATNVNRFKQLDELLLTQGWRGFVWKKIADTTLNITYQPEQGISITGKVRRVGVKKGLSGISVTMRAPKAEGQKLFWTTTDSTGRFAIDDTKFYGYQYISFTSRKSDKINRDGESKGSSGGYIQVDSLLRDTLTIGPEASTPQSDTAWLASRQADRAIEQIRKSMRIKNDHNLKEVIIKANTNRLVTRLPPEIHAITLNEQKGYDNLMQYLLDKVEGSSQNSDTCYWCSGSPQGLMSQYLYLGRAIIRVTGTYVDKTPINYCAICQEQYLNLPMSNVLKVTINRSEDVYGKHISVNVILRPGVLDTKDYFDNTMADMVGYYKARVFYKPEIEKPDDIDPRTNTIHWESNITTDKNGEATINFYNTAQIGKIRLMVEGMTADGIPLTATAVYEVK